MATIEPVTILSQLHSAALLIEWAPMAAGDTANFALLGHYQEKSVHVYGVWGGATVTLNGTNETVPTAGNSVQMIDYYQNEISLTSNAFKRVMENPLFIVPLLAGGDGTTSLTVRLLCRN